ncbi:hypothetical protein [Winogradskyella sp.]|nr:hypothetical protein [Winogradskyella sp.]
MYTRSDNVFVYYKKDNPENPLGTLVFEPETSKLVSWVLLCQGN